MKNIIRFVKYALLFALGIFLFAVFYPRKYDVPPYEQPAGAQFWTLPTGSRIAYYVVSAKAEKKPYSIIFLQGGPGGFISDRNIAMLAPLSENGYDVYLYDQIGSGASDRLDHPQEYTVERHKRDLEAIIRQIGSEKVILIGQSWGAILATLFVADHPDLVQKLILTGPGPVFPIRQEFANLPAPDSLHLRKPMRTNSQANEKINNIRTKTVALWAKLFGTKLASDKEMDNFQTVLTGELNKSTVCDTANARKAKGGSGYYAELFTLQSLVDVKDPRPTLNNVKIPLCIMRGQCDNQKWGVIPEYLELFPQHRLAIIPDAGHSISVEQPELYLKTLRDFLNESF